MAFSFADALKKGDWVDAKEKEGSFRLAKVVHIEDKEVSVRFEDFDEYRRDCVTPAPLRNSTSTPRGWPRCAATPWATRAPST